MEEKKNRREGKYLFFPRRRKMETCLRRKILFCGKEDKRRRKGEIILRGKMSFFLEEGKVGK